MAFRGASWGEGRRLRLRGRGCGVKCRLVLHFRSGVVGGGIGVRTHFCGACWRTTSGCGEDGAGRSLMRSRAVIAAPPWLCGAQARTEIQLAAGEPFDDQHDAGAGWTAQAGWLGRIGAGGCAEQSAAAFERSTSSTVGEESEVSDANQALGQNVDEEAAQELMGGNGHDLLLAAVGIVSPAEGDAIVLEGHEAMVGDGDAVSVAGQVVENMFGAAERRLGINHPVLLAELPEEVAESGS